MNFDKYFPSDLCGLQNHLRIIREYAQATSVTFTTVQTSFSKRNLLESSFLFFISLNVLINTPVKQVLNCKGVFIKNLNVV